MAAPPRFHGQPSSRKPPLGLDGGVRSGSLGFFFGASLLRTMAGGCCFLLQRRGRRVPVFLRFSQLNPQPDFSLACWDQRFLSRRSCLADTGGLLVLVGFLR
uniref:Uncharacterized protein n=1 Tax=Zea mays TaxID=4577 RepID=C4J8B2_MAIZE|nr:unknown [Zea mays]